MEHRRRVIGQWKRGQDHQGVEREDGQVPVDADRALRLVRFFPSNFSPLPEFLRVLNHLIQNGSVRSVAWTPDGKNIASGSDDETIKIWNAQTGQCVSTLSGHSRYVTAVSYSCLFSNVWCVLTFEHFTAMSRVFPSVRTANTLPVAATTRVLEFGRCRLARACRR
jgi:hypothetical protein